MAKKKTSIKGIAGGVAAVFVMGVIGGVGGSGDETPAASSSAQSFGDVSISTSAPASSASSELLGTVEFSDSSSIIESDSEPVVYTYIANSNTMKFHRLHCASIDDIKESNKVEFEGRDTAIDAGYSPCGRCDP